MTVRELVEMGRDPRAGWFRRLGRDHREAVDAALERVGMARSPTARSVVCRAASVSVLIARALAQETPVLLLDEPFAGVDARTEAALLDLMRDLTAGGHAGARPS